MENFSLCHTSEAPSIQALALAATKSGASRPDLQELAKLGNFGNSPQHIYEQMVSKYCKSEAIHMPGPYVVDIPVVVTKESSTAVQWRPVAFFLPHEWFGWISSSNLSEDQREQLAGWSHLEQFWEEHDLLDPKLENNPVMDDGNDPANFLPLLLHGDGGAFQRNDSINVISMRSLLSSSSVSMSQMLLAAIPKAAVNKSEKLEEDTMHQIWKVLVWSFKHMFEGRYPAFNHLGSKFALDKGSEGSALDKGKDKSKAEDKALHKGKSEGKALNKGRAQMAGELLHPDGLCGWLFGITGDGEYVQNEFKLKGASHNECCFSCHANKSDIPHNDFRAGAKWRASVVRHSGTCPAKHLISKVPGVVGECFHYDLLHIMEAGVASHICANVCFDFTIRPGWPGNQDARCKLLYDKILQQYQEQGTDASNRIGRLRLSNFCNPKAKFDTFPEMSGCKARHIRYLVPCLLEICRDQVDDKKPYTKHRMKCLFYLEKAYQTMEDHMLHLPEKAFNTLQVSMDSCLLNYVACSKICLEQGLLQWNTVHKHHLSAHIPQQAEFINPRFLTTYGGETMVGLVSSTAHSCLNGTPSWQVPEKVCWRYRLGMWLRMSNNDMEDQ